MVLALNDKELAHEMKVNLSTDISLLLWVLGLGGRAGGPSSSVRGTYDLGGGGLLGSAAITTTLPSSTPIIS